ncbi:phage baseplate assembly protein V [Streptomyces durhamensis]|uniref:phage baseplate assembly protein V n=1 Tax=Streptomyces durhamensis TaxID=68194 RepID=UPI000A4FA323|nr:phage baseplate assembly protein V [Streptomyces durhamensis]
MTADMLDHALLAVGARTDGYYGKYRGTITSVDDPLKSGRVKAKVPEVLGDVETGWALPCTPYAGQRSGLYTIPPVGAPAWVEFEAGDPSRPIWSGGWWGPLEAPGEPTSPLPSPARRELTSETGLTVALDDDGHTLTVSDLTGQNLLEIKAQSGQVTLKALTQVTLEAPVIAHGQQATEPAVLGTQLLSYLTQLTTLFNTHIHPGQLAAGALPVTPAPPVAPFTPPPASMLSTKNLVE